MKFRIAFLLFTISITSSQVYENEIDEGLQFHIIVKYPESSLPSQGARPTQHQLYIRGNGLGLSWDTGSVLSKTGTDTWVLSVKYRRSVQGFTCDNCSDTTSLSSNKFQYRIFLDDTTDMLGANFAIQFPISASSTYFLEPPQFLVYPWFYSQNGTTESFTVNSTIINSTRKITMYYPPSFNENTYKTYEAAILFDLDPEFKFIPLSWDILQGPIIPHALTEEYILIGFGDFSTEDDTDRLDLLTPTAGQFMVCINGTESNGCGGCVPLNASVTEYLELMRTECGTEKSIGGHADETLDFLLKEALPTAKDMTNNRIKAPRLNIMGYSLGGLMSCYAAWTRPYDFKNAACMSSSFFWPTNVNVTEAYYDFLNKTLKDPTYWYNRTKQSIYIDIGGLETDPPVYMAQTSVEVANRISEHELFTMNENLWLHISPNKRHGPPAFNERFWKAAVAVFPAAGDPGMSQYTDMVNGGHTIVDSTLIGLCLIAVTLNL